MIWLIAYIVLVILICRFFSMNSFDQECELWEESELQKQEDLKNYERMIIEGIR